MRYLVVFPGPNKIQTIKVIRELLNLNLRDALNLLDQPPTSIRESLDLTQFERVMQAQGIEYAILDGKPKRMTGCCVCGAEKVRHWVSHELFLDPDDVDRFGGQPMCSRCWRTVPFEKVMSKTDPPTFWARLGDMLEDE